MTTPIRALILEDRPADAELMAYELRRAGFEPDWTRVETESHYRACLDSTLDVILADYSLPQFDALQALRLLREYGLDIPFIVVSGSIGEDMAVECIKQGAADYLLKDRLGRLGQAVARSLDERRLRAEKRRAETALRESEERFRRLTENSQGIVYRYRLTAPRGFEYVSPASTRISGHSPEEFYADPDLAVKSVHPDDQMILQQAMEKQEDLTRPVVLRWVRRDGAIVWMEHRNVPIFDPAGSLVAIEGIALDVTERKGLETQLVHLATHDHLTHLFNRRHFQEELGRQLAQVRRYGGRGALLCLDLDNFKDVNDSLGHLAGDELLVSLAGVLRERLRETDVLARTGGDEFAVLLQFADPDQARAVAEHLLEEIQHHAILIGGRLVGVTATIGIVLFPEHGTTVEELFARADFTLYQAKESGRNCLKVYAPDRDWQGIVESRLGWRQRLQEALDADRFLLHAQPVLDLRTNRISQYELLLRLADEAGAIVLPGAFLDLAERFGLIHEIDRHVVRRAIQLLARQREAGQELRLEVNLSGKSLADGELLPLIEDALRTTAIDPARLILEVTETAAIANIQQAQRFVGTLKKLGCQFALDDFGVGFSSFYRLKYLPVDYLKIDGSFIRDLPHDPQDQHLVRAMVEVARGLGKETIAEFVGDEETVQVLRDCGVGYAQGYHIGRPTALF